MIRGRPRLFAPIPHWASVPCFSFKAPPYPFVDSSPVRLWAAATERQVHPRRSASLRASFARRLEPSRGRQSDESRGHEAQAHRHPQRGRLGRQPPQGRGRVATVQTLAAYRASTPCEYACRGTKSCARAVPRLWLPRKRMARVRIWGEPDRVNAGPTRNQHQRRRVGGEGRGEDGEAVIGICPAFGRPRAHVHGPADGCEPVPHAPPNASALSPADGHLPFHG